MPDFITHCSLPFLIAQTAGGVPAPTAGAAPSTTVYYWIAIFLVATGMAVLGIIAAKALRGRRAAESDAEPETQAYTPAPTAPVPARVVAAPAARLVAPSQPSPTTLEAQNLLRLMGEAEELCTRLGRELDDKAERLERLLARAEGRLGSTTPPQPSYNAPIPTPPAAPTYQPPRPEIVTRPVAVPTPAAPVLAGSPNGPSLYYAPPVSAPSSHFASQPTPTPVPQAAAQSFAPAPKRGPDPFGLDPLTRDIYTLADAGHSPAAIAQQLGQHTGKVELILALRSA